MVESRVKINSAQDGRSFTFDPGLSTVGLGNPEDTMEAAQAFPEAKRSFTERQLAGLQSAAAVHLTFHITLACPLKCAHCIVEAGPGMQHTTMPAEVARRYASQMPELYAYGIRLVSFTGGEPLLAREQLETLSNAAAAAGMTCGVVTAAHWAASERVALRVVDGLPGISIWDMSIDAYHEPFVSPERVRTAYHAVKSRGREPVVRFAYHQPMTQRDRELKEFIQSFADEPEICSQRIRSVGRASDLPVINSPDDTTFAKPCLTKGLVIRYDGSMAPCCINLVEERRHPFQFGDARERPLTEIHAEYLAHPLLQMIRVLGFGPVMRWLEEAGVPRESLGPMPDDVCDFCPKVVTNPKWAEYLAARAASPENRLKLAVLARNFLGEPGMLGRAVEELRGCGSEIEGFELAERLAAEDAAGSAP
ncbi:MAG: radical SAM protein [Terriglobia bacterium]